MRRKSSKVWVGDVAIGGDSPVSIQSMTNTSIADVDKTLSQIERLVYNGCELVRIAVPKIESVKFFEKIKKKTNVPLIADIHFNHKIAIAAIEAGADKVRINPGNIGGKQKFKEVVAKAINYNVPLRIGVNSGSIEKDILEKENGPTVNAIVKSAIRHLKLAREFGATQLVLSLKSSNVLDTISAYKKVSNLTDAPLHVGLTEAGTINSGTVKSSVAIGVLLHNGIGDTIRVSLTGNPENEIKVAKTILSSLDLTESGVEIISCPTCGRTNIDLEKIADEIEKSTLYIKKNIKVAIMGCEVNGPGEAKEADVGIAFGKNTGILFRKGKIIKRISSQSAYSELLSEIQMLN
jgi:(E)-4-hydroxy-3-methylbut-2-enyl-diphosphate synthase